MTDGTFCAHSVCLSIRKSCQRRDCSELGTVRNWVDHCIQISGNSAFFRLRFFLLINVKMPTIVGILTIISTKMSCSVELGMIFYNLGT